MVALGGWAVSYDRGNPVEGGRAHSLVKTRFILPERRGSSQKLAFFLKLTVSPTLSTIHAVESVPFSKSQLASRD